jgi:hypothetical protein
MPAFHDIRARSIIVATRTRDAEVDENGVPDVAVAKDDVRRFTSRWRLSSA